MRTAAATLKRPRAGFTVSNIGTHLFTTEIVYRLAQEAEAERTTKKRKAVVDDGSEDEEGAEDNPFRIQVALGSPV